MGLVVQNVKVKVRVLFVSMDAEEENIYISHTCNTGLINETANKMTHAMANMPKY